jgi:Xaa-Pro aminopeptidase
MDTLDSRRATVRTRIDTLRQAMARAGLAAIIVPSSDPHLSEYLPDRWKGREYLSGFTGSVGTLVVTRDAAGVWVDSRYWTQAEVQLAGTGVDLMKLPGTASLAHVDWLATTLKRGDTVAVDGTVLALAAGRALEAALTAKGIRLRTDLDILSEIWPDRASLPIPPIYEHVPPFATTPRSAKFSAVREDMRKAAATHHFISTLDDIAWLTNLRGADVSYNPVFVAHLLLDARSARLFVADGKIENGLKSRLAADGIEVAPYTQAAAALAALPPAATLLIDPRRITLGMRQVVAPGVEVIEAINPTTMAKSRKTAAEAAHVRATMEQDGAALAEFFAWFESALGKELITELTIDEKIIGARARRPGFVCPSFTTIAAFNANGAQPHYRATEESHATIGTPGATGNGMLLIDSGGQYLGGTTDITRVVPVGTTTAEQRRDYTLVLKGMIALSVARFPRGTRSPLLDTLARAPIWAAGIDFGHGTGHGVGYFLNVHEGPHGITPHLAPEPQTAMEPGMITSNEPGIYRPGQWGVRIENLVLNVPGDLGEFGEFLRFETLTLCPIDTRLIERTLMRPDEIGWLNAYHDEVRRRVSPHVSGAAALWLQERTAPI